MYMQWADFDTKKTPHQKIAEALAHYAAKYGKEANECLVNEKDATTYDGIDVRVVAHVRPNLFLIGTKE